MIATGIADSLIQKLGNEGGDRALRDSAGETQTTVKANACFGFGIIPLTNNTLFPWGVDKCVDFGLSSQKSVSCSH